MKTSHIIPANNLTNGSGKISANGSKVPTKPSGRRLNERLMVAHSGSTRPSHISSRPEPE